MSVSEYNISSSLNEDLTNIAIQVQAILDKYDMGNDGSNLLTLIDKLIPSNGQLFEELETVYNLIEEGYYYDANEIINNLSNIYPNNIHVISAATTLSLETSYMD